MAKLIISVILILSSLFLAMPNGYARTQGLEPETSWFESICKGKEKIAKVHFYVQDVLGGENRTVYEVAQASITPNSTTYFGQVRVVDDLLTAGPDYNSQALGRVQGLITSADLFTSALAMNLNFVFTAGKYKGSTISILGRNQLGDPERELAVGGGTGKFRFGRGYALTSTYWYNADTTYGVLEYTIYITYVDHEPTIRLFGNV